MKIDDFSHSIERRDKISDTEFWEEFSFSNKPVVLEGYMKNWNAFNKWNSDFFDNKYGDLSVEVSASNDRNNKKKMTLRDFLLYIKNTKDKDPYYLRDWVIENEAPELFSDYSTPTFFKSWIDYLPSEIKPKLKWLYIGPKGSGSPLHTDIWDTSAWNGVFTGKKLWNFYPLDQLEFLYDLRVDSFNPDYEKYPLLKNTTPISCIQNPGDIVFTPSGWVHQVYNLEAGISITENFVNKSNAHIVKDIFEKNKETELLMYLKSLMEFVKNNSIDF